MPVHALRFANMSPNPDLARPRASPNNVNTRKRNHEQFKKDHGARTRPFCARIPALCPRPYYRIIKLLRITPLPKIITKNH